MYTTSNLSATAPSDYQAKSGTLTFSPGQTIKTVNVTTVDDSGLNECDEEFKLTLSNPVGTTIASATGVGHIIDGDYCGG